MICPKCERETYFVISHDPEFNITEMYCHYSDCLWHLTPKQIKHFNYYNTPKLEFVERRRGKNSSRGEKIKNYDLNPEFYNPGTICGGDYIGDYLLEQLSDIKNFKNRVKSFNEFLTN